MTLRGVGSPGVAGAPMPAGASDSRRIALNRERLAAWLQRSGAVVALVVVVVLATLVFGGRFASVDNFLNILEASAFLGLVAVGMTFVIVGGGIRCRNGGARHSECPLVARPPYWR